MKQTKGVRLVQPQCKRGLQRKRIKKLLAKLNEADSFLEWQKGQLVLFENSVATTSSAILVQFATIVDAEATTESRKTDGDCPVSSMPKNMCCDS